MLEARQLWEQEKHDQAADLYAEVAGMEEEFMQECKDANFASEYFTHAFSAIHCWLHAGNFYRARFLGNIILEHPDVSEPVQERVQALLEGIQDGQQLYARVVISSSFNEFMKTVRKEGDKYTWMTFAVSRRDRTIVERLLQERIIGDVNQWDWHGRFPITVAVENDDLDMVRLLHHWGASISGQRNPLWRARSAVMVDLLVELGADPNGKTEGLAPLHNAIYEDNFTEVIEALIKHGADINVKTEYDSTPLWEAIAHYASGDVVACLLDHGAEIPYPPDSCEILIEWLQGTDPWRGDLIAFVREYQRTNGDIPSTFGEFLSSHGESLSLSGDSLSKPGE
ncbi:ankyrin repeat domain-containing protein [Armatimonas rosea]|uniref:Ankyrin repeat protein n=1 Tax=Armatimonas rosea TaxID=685828 RepID=A0A7W9SL03_ARMRO|nr:ankyrin repeat domain-containing protein [Armatimonas rosea]MBB6048567.1 hypothetical protein [Armatimonas rosea]